MRTALLLILALAACRTSESRPEPALMPPADGSVRIGATQPRSRLIPFEMREPSEVLDRVDRTLEDLVGLLNKAADAGCEVVVFPEDTLGLGHWEAGNSAILDRVLPEAVRRMLDRLGRAAAERSVYLICCNDTVDARGVVRNVAFFLGKDGKEIGRYQKVNMPIHELYKERGTGFPVFPTPDLGGVGMLICYDMVFPEAARCLALGGADIVFHPTLGGAAIGGGEISRAAFRTRAVENFVYIVVSQRGSGSMIISPKGEILVEAKGSDSIAIADIVPAAGREGGDAMNHQRDMRARLFRERSPEAYGILTRPDPPGLTRVPETMSIDRAVEVSRATLTVGEGRFKAAATLQREGRTDEAIRAYERLIEEFPKTWIDRVSRKRLADLRK